MQRSDWLAFFPEFLHHEKSSERKIVRGDEK
jgi:hypothetical protein